MTCHEFYDRKPSIFVSLFYSNFFVCVCVSLSLLFLFSVSIVGARTYEGKNIKPTSFCVFLPCKKKQLVVIHRCLGARGRKNISNQLSFANKKKQKRNLTRQEEKIPNIFSLTKKNKKKQKKRKKTKKNKKKQKKTKKNKKKQKKTFKNVFKRLKTFKNEKKTKKNKKKQKKTKKNV